MKSAARLALAAAAALSASGCCGFLERKDATPSRDFLARTVGRRIQGDAETTAQTLTGLPCALRDEWNDATGRMAGTCRLYGTGSTR